MEDEEKEETDREYVQGREDVNMLRGTRNANYTNNSQPEPAATTTTVCNWAEALCGSLISDLMVNNTKGEEKRKVEIFENPEKFKIVENKPEVYESIYSDKLLFRDNQVEYEPNGINKLNRNMYESTQRLEVIDKICNACNFCEDVCFSTDCVNCEKKRKNLYEKYKKYKKQNLRICQKKAKLMFKLNKRVRRDILLGSHSMEKGYEEEKFVNTEKNCTSEEGIKEEKQSKTPLSTINNIDENEKRGDQYDTLKDVIRKSTSMSNNEWKTEEKGEKTINYYNYTKYKKYFTKCEIKRHCKINDCWVVANGCLYDVTTILSHHPGGVNCILKKAGGDVSVDYSFHSKYAQKIFWEPLKIGKVITCSKELDEVHTKSFSSPKKSTCFFM
ncbi:hypothetical protein, conserved [Plasmodium gonderi]|uniref:Cytochrome b5 heme-binding domain-containing protein n=1 Tax=Plasmodium gonderi TaxID=77519 RepID=A0A1Y1JN27_PLAGO|nr:hypothetical protein, conserved [Plasmodium gonderi]GAW82948.1 hypothetical protein, conserved [Plasmodium gonderi]